MFRVIFHFLNDVPKNSHVLLTETTESLMADKVLLRCDGRPPNEMENGGVLEVALAGANAVGTSNTPVSVGLPSG